MSPVGLGPYPRGPPVSSLAFRDREAEWRARGPMPMNVGGPRPYDRDLRHIRKTLTLPRRPQQPRGPPGPAVDRYKSQSR